MSPENRSIPDITVPNSFLHILGINLLRIFFFFLFFLPALWIQNKQLNEVRTKPKLYRDSLYMPSGKSIRLVSIGYDRFISDFIWLRSIQAFGGHWETDRNYEPIFHLFDVITDLDPSFIDAYTFGNLVIGDEGGDQRLGLELINKGIWKNPRKYKLPYWAGYVSYWQLNDPTLAKYYYSRAIKCPDSPGFVSRIIAYMELKSGRYQVAFEKLLQDMLIAIDDKDDVVEGIVQRRLPDVFIEWHVFILKQAVEKYVANKGETPKSVQDLEEAGAIDPYPLIPVTVLYNVIEQFKLIPGKMIDHLPQILEKARLENYTSLPPHPRGYWYQLNPEVSPEDENFVMDGEKLVSGFQEFLFRKRREILMFHDRHNRFPYTLKEFFPQADEDKDFFGGEWNYIPGLAIFYSSAMPVL